MPQINVTTPEPSEWPDRPAAVHVNLRITPHQVSAHELSGGSVALVLGDDDAAVSVLGDIDTVIAVVGQALDQLMALRNARSGQ